MAEFADATMGTASLLLGGVEGTIGNVSGKLAVKQGFNATSFADDIIALNKATDGGGVLIKWNPVFCN